MSNSQELSTQENRSEYQNSNDNHSELVNVEKYKNERWTKIIKIEDAIHSQIQIFLLKEELEELESDPLKPLKARKQPWSLVFDPEKLVKGDKELKMENFQLTENKLREQAKLCSMLRQQIRDQAIIVDKLEPKPPNTEEIKMSQLVEKIHKGYHRSKKRKNNPYLEELVVETPSGTRRRQKHRRKLSTQDKLLILKRVVLENELESEVAKEVRTTVARVSQIVSAARKKPEALREIIVKDYE